LTGVFTDGDLRRKLQSEGRGILDKTFAAIGFSKTPHTLDRDSLLNDAVKLFKKAEVDSIVVVDGTRPVGVLDVQDLIKLGLLGQEHL
jgi:CBS domain-containing protein